MTPDPLGLRSIREKLHDEGLAVAATALLGAILGVTLAMFLRLGWKGAWAPVLGAALVTGGLWLQNRTLAGIGWLGLPLGAILGAALYWWLLGLARRAR